jgi:hypothetical protein
LDLAPCGLADRNRRTWPRSGRGIRSGGCSVTGGAASLDAGVEEGSVETVPLRPTGGLLIVNADAAQGELRVAVLDEQGRPLPGYEQENCLPLTADRVWHEVRWQGHDQLPEDRPLRLRFHLKQTRLYSFAM